MPCDDVYVVGPSPFVRWRPFVDLAAPWCPAVHHDKLLMQREFAARTVYELSLLLELCGPEWTSVETLRDLRTAASVELRVAEVEIASFQLTANTVGIDLSLDRDVLFEAALFVHAAHLYLHDAVTAVRALKRGRKEALALRPSRTDTPYALADALDKNLHALHVLLQNGLGVVRRLTPDADLPRWTHRLRKVLDLAVIRGLDRVLLVTPDCESGSCRKKV